VRDHRERAARGLGARPKPTLIVGSLSCALLDGDVGLFTEFVTWSRGLPDARRVQSIVLDESLAAIGDALGPGFPGALRTIAAASAR
jgi:hypothetical protein